MASLAKGDGTEQGVLTSPGKELTVLILDLWQRDDELSAMAAEYEKPEFPETHIVTDPDNSIIL